MCIFADSVKHVSNTKILVYETVNSTQVTVYENKVQIDSRTQKNAMILPCPYEKGDNITLYNLEGLKTLFNDLEATFPVIKRNLLSKGRSRGIDDDNDSTNSLLEIVQVGCYKVSIATSISDLKLVDKSVFTLPKNIEEIMNKYYRNGFAFVICAFANKNIEPHPIAYESRKPSKDELFVPTRHAHGGAKESEQFKADWDHVMYSINTKVGKDDHDKLSLNSELERANKYKKDVDYTVTFGDRTLQDSISNLKKSLVPVPKNSDKADLVKHTLVGLYQNNDVMYSLL